MSLFYEQECYAIRGAIFEVYKKQVIVFLNLCIRNILKESSKPRISLLFQSLS